MKRSHDNTEYIHKNVRPSLAIESRGGANLGRCYNASYFDVTSLSPLSMEDLLRLRECGFLGYGQEFMAYQVVNGERISVPKSLDWKTKKDVKESGHDIVPCVMIDRTTREVVPGEAINPYSGKAYEPQPVPFYIYRCESRVDSSD